ncbi:MAG: hypothetical protein WCI53_13510 [Bacteroidota bacterium]|jgi:hypothetical protein
MNYKGILIFIFSLFVYSKSQAQRIVWCNVAIVPTDSIILKKQPYLLTWDTLSFTRYEPKSNSIITFKYCNQTKHDSCKQYGNKKNLFLTAKPNNDFECVLINIRDDNTEIINSILIYGELKKYVKRNSKNKILNSKKVSRK